LVSLKEFLPQDSLKGKVRERRDETIIDTEVVLMVWNKNITETRKSTKEKEESKPQK